LFLFTVLGWPVIPILSLPFSFNTTGKMSIVFLSDLNPSSLIKIIENLRRLTHSIKLGNSLLQSDWLNVFFVFEKKYNNMYTIALKMSIGSRFATNILQYNSGLLWNVIITNMTTYYTPLIPLHRHEIKFSLS